MKPERPSADAVWCRSHFALLKDGGTWGVPRSGLIFRREGDGLVLQEMMLPTETPPLPVTVEQVREMQENDYEEIRRAFEEAGISVRRDDD